jgi:hypothetical protein
MTIRLHFPQEDWARIAHDYTAWWAHDLGRPLVRLVGRQLEPGISYPAVHDFISNYPLYIPAEEIIARVTPHLEACRYYGDAFPQWRPNLGPGINAAFLGAQVHPVEETTWFSPTELRDPQDLCPAYEETNPWWGRAREITQAAVTAWGSQVQVACTDLVSGLDTLASLRTTERLLLDLCDAPEQVDRLVGKLASLFLRYYDELDAIIAPVCPGRSSWAELWSPGPGYMLQSDFAYMISPAMFERFVLPDVVACCEHLEYPFYHLDGVGQIPHLDMLLEAPRLRGIQWVPGDGAPPPEEWLDLLKRIIDHDKLCQVFVTAPGALRIVRALGGKGFQLSIRDEMDADEAPAFLELLAREGGFHSA